MPPSGFVVRLPCARPGVFSGANIMFFSAGQAKTHHSSLFSATITQYVAKNIKSKEDGRKFPVILLNVMYVASLYYGFIV